jgi:hypothetical protein
MGGTPSLQMMPTSPAPGFSQAVPAHGPVDGQTESDKHEIERLRRTNKLYDTYAPEWDLELAAYEGGGEMASEKNLFKHNRENDEDFLDRVKRIHYINYCDVLVDFFTNFIFAESIHRDAGNAQAFYDTFSTNVDRRGTSINDYMKSLSDDIQIFGMVYTLVDSPPAQSTVVTKQNEKEQGISPYWVLIRPAEITDWIVDDFDVFSYCKRKQEQEKLGLSGEKLQIEHYTEWYIDKIVISEIDVTDSRNPRLLPSKSLENAVKKIPLKVHRFKRSKRYHQMGNSFLRDFAYNNREIMNLTSLLQEFLYRQCFNILAKQSDTSIPSASQEDGVVGTANVLEYPKGATPPAYITPPADPAKFLQDERTKIQQEMFRRAAQDTLNELFNGQGASGFSQAQSFSKTVPFIATRADILEKAENELMQLTLEYVGKSWNGKVKYKDRYEITNLTDAMTQLVTLARDLQLPSKTFVVEELKRLVDEYDGKINPDTLVKIKKEIDGLDFSEWQDTQKQALIGQPKAPPEGSSPTSQGKSKSKGTSAESAGKAGGKSTPPKAT